jgi:hypothetical protein
LIDQQKGMPDNVAGILGLSRKGPKKWNTGPLLVQEL